MVKSGEISRLKKLLAGDIEHAVVIPHMSPDGDAVGSCMAWVAVMEKIGIDAVMVSADDVADYLKFMIREERFVSAHRNLPYCQKLISQADAVFMMDHNSYAREGILGGYTEKSGAVKVLIDHHLDPVDGDIVFSDPHSPATCMLEYEIIVELWGREMIDPHIANLLYAGISTDTGNFNHAASNPELYRTVADLLDRGLDRDYVFENIYQTATENRLRLTGNALLNDMRLDGRYPVAVIAISLEELEKFGYKDGDLEGVVNMPLAMKDIKVSILVTERKDKVKLSVRSKGAVAVDTWCRTYFNGGGHKNASGGRMDIPFSEVIDRVDRYIPEIFVD